MVTKERALVVDDEMVVCQGVKKILNKKDLEVDIALSANEALTKMSEGNYGVVLADMMMPEVTGMQLLETIKTKDPRTSVIMITGYPTIRTAVQAIKLGASDYIPKPFTPDELTSATLRAIARTRIYEEERVKKKIPGVVIKEKEVPEVKPEEVEIHGFEGELFCIPEHAWARVERDGNVRIGMEYMFQMNAGVIINIDLPFEGDEVRQGEVFTRITSSGLRIHKLCSPITGKVIEVNEPLNRDFSLAKEDPREKAWFIKAKPTNLKEDLKNLASVNSAR